MNDSLQLFSKELSIVTKPIPKVTNPDDVLIKVAYSGICGTDLHIINGDYLSSSKAFTLGHEFSGTVQSVGTAVANLKVGDRVVVDPNTQCHVCRFCKTGQPHFCLKGRTETSIGVFRNGGWANYCRVPAYLVYKIPDGLSLKTAVFVEPMSCVQRGWKRLDGIKQGSKILIIGGGVIGLLWASFLHHKGYRDLTMSEISQHRRGVAGCLDLGIQVVHPHYLDKCYTKAQETGDNDWGFNIIIDCSGSPIAIEQALNWVKFGGKFLIFGVSPKESKIKINPFCVFSKELTIAGSLVNPFTFESAISIVHSMEKYLDYDKIGTKVYTLQDYPSALESLKKGLSSKAVFKMAFDED